MHVNKLIQTIAKQLKASGVRIANVDHVVCTTNESQDFARKLWELDSNIIQIQSLQGIFYYKPDAVNEVCETSFFHQNLLSDPQLEKYMRDSMQLMLDSRLATCVNLCITAYYMAMEAQKHEYDQITIEVIQAKYWSHNLMRFQLGEYERFFDPWVMLQPQRFPNLQSSFARPALPGHLRQLYSACAQSRYPILPTQKFFNIATRQWLKSSRRDLDFTSFYVAYGNQWRNKPPIVNHFKDLALPLRLFGKSSQQGLRVGRRLSILEGILFLLYHTTMGNEKSSAAHALLPLMAITLVLATAIGKFNSLQTIEDTQAKLSLKL